MARGINKAIIVGSVGRGPDIRYTSNGSAVANLSVATNEQWKDKQTGQKQERTEWHRISAFGRLAEIIGEYVKKGQQIYIEGRIQTRKWQDKDGQDRYTTKIVANEMQMLGGGHVENSQSNRQIQGDVSNSQQNVNASAGQGGNFDDFDDDVAF